MMMLVLAFSGFACDRPAHPAAALPAPEVDEPAGQAAVKQAVFAGGCFWCVEAVFQQLEGVEQVTSGYAGGTAETASYEMVSSGQTDHAEVVELVYDPGRISYGQLLRVFFATHDPTQLNRQGPDHGRQYRSAIFFADEDQRRAAEAYIAQLNEAKVYDRPIVTTLEPLEAFYPAEQYHHNFVQRNPSHPYVRQWALPKVEKVREKFGEQVR